MDARTKSSAVDRVVRLCRDLTRLGPPGIAQMCREIADGVGEPLRIAVVGRVKAGKSTLVNALIGAKVAATNATECTRIVTWYRYGISAPTELVLRDGRVHELPVSGYVPDELAVPADQLSHAVVYLQEQSLQEFTLIDTPGLETSTLQNEAAARRAVLTSEAGMRADAIVYVFKRAEYADDLDFVREFNRLGGAAGRSIGVLSSADLFGSGPWHANDPIDAAAAFATEMAHRHAASLGTIVPFAGRMAEASRTGEVREDDARALAHLAEFDDIDLQDLELSPFDVDGLDSTVVARILRSFRGYPLRHGRTIARDGASSLSRWLLDRSGFAALEGELRSRYVALSPQLKLQQSVARLRDMVRDVPQNDALIEMIESARNDPALHVLQELHAHDLLITRSPQSPLIATLEHLMTAPNDRARLRLPASATGADIHLEARRRASEEVANAAVAIDNATDNAHLVLAQSYRLLAQRHAEQP